MTISEFLLSAIFLGLSIWLIALSQATYHSVEIHARITAKPRIFLIPKKSRVAEWRASLPDRLRPMTWILYGHPSRQRAFHVLAIVLGVVPAGIYGIVLLLNGQDTVEAILFLSLGLTLVLLLRIEYYFARFGYLEVGGGGAEDPFGLYLGYAKLPKKVYLGDSKNVVIKLSPSLQVSTDNENAVWAEKEEGGQIGLSVRVPLAMNTGIEYLEIGLLAAGFEIKGEIDQRQQLNSPELLYLWNCYYPNSGDHSYAVRFRKVTGAVTSLVGHIEDTVRVSKMFNLTQTQVYMIAAVFGIPSGLYLFISAMKSLVEALVSLR